MANKISVILDVATDKAVSGLKGFKQSITDADGSVNKFKAGASSAFGAIQSAGIGMAAAAGSAIVAFGVKSVDAFTDAAVAAGKFADATGLSSEEASRWVAVGDDIGISAEAMEKSFGKLAVSIGKNNPLLEEYGIVVKKGADGQDDMNATMLNAVDVIKGIQDPTTKAAVAQAALGKGWMEMAELIEQGSDSLTTSMANVSEAQVIDEAEVEKARRMRESMDNLQDSVRDLSLELGEKLIPTVVMLADGLTVVIGQADNLTKALLGPLPGLAKWVGIMDDTSESTENAAIGIGRMASALDNAAGVGTTVEDVMTALQFAIDSEAQATAEAFDKTTELTEGLQEHADAMSEQAESYADNAVAALGWMDDVQTSMESAGGSISEFSEDAMADIDTFQQELSDNVEDLNNWQNGIVSIAAKTSPEFAGFLAEMGLAGAGLVTALDGNQGELETTFEQWKLAAAVAGRDVPAEIAKADPETQRIIERLGRNVISTLGAQKTPTAAAAKAVGTAIVDGMRAGVDAGAQQVARSAAAVVNQALAAAQNAGDIHSPSKLFMDEVGTPIAEGIEEGILEGADDIGKALDKAIKSAEKDALDAVDDLVDAAKDRFQDAWDSPDTGRNVERLNERISDATVDVAEAQMKANDAAREFGYNSPEFASAAEALTDAQRSLRDANYALLKASEDLIGQGPAGLAMFDQLGAAAGLTGAEINALVASYQALTQAQFDAAVAASAITDEVKAAQDTRARFGNAAAAGLVPQSWIDHISQFTNDPRFVVELMNAFLGSLPNFAGGGIVPGPTGSPQLIVAHGGEPVGMNGNGGGGLTANITVNAGMGADGREIGDIIVGKIREYERRNGNGWRG